MLGPQAHFAPERLVHPQTSTGMMGLWLQATVGTGLRVSEHQTGTASSAFWTTTPTDCCHECGWRGPHLGLHAYRAHGMTSRFLDLDPATTPLTQIRA